MECMNYSRLRALSKVSQGEAPGPETTLYKLIGSHLLQEVVDLHQRVLGPLGVLWNDAPYPEEIVEMGKHAAHIRQTTIGGGTSEVQRNIVAKRILKLPD